MSTPGMVCVWLYPPGVAATSPNRLRLTGPIRQLICSSDWPMTERMWPYSLSLDSSGCVGVAGVSLSVGLSAVLA